MFTDAVVIALSSRAPPDVVKVTSVIGWHALHVLNKSNFEYSSQMYIGVKYTSVELVARLQNL